MRLRLADVVDVGSEDGHFQAMLFEGVDHFWEIFFDAFGQDVAAFADGGFDTVEAALGQQGGGVVVAEELQRFFKGAVGPAVLFGEAGQWCEGCGGGDGL